MLYAISLTLPATLDDERAGFLLDAPGEFAGGVEILSCAAGRDGRDHRGAWTLQWFCEDRPALDEILARLNAVRGEIAPELPAFEQLALEDVPDVNWLEQSYQQFPPFREGSFFIFGSHYQGDKPGDAIPLQIDAATAFGSGEHGTTSGCLNALDYLKAHEFDARNMLDLGTGSGILAIAAWYLFGGAALGTDIDPEAVRVADEHRALNHVPNDAANGIVNVVSDGFAQGLLKDRAPYDLTIANILAGPLKEMAEDIIHVTRPGGYILLSGMLNDQAEEVRALYETHGAFLHERFDRGDWTSLLLTRRS